MATKNPHIKQCDSSFMMIRTIVVKMRSIEHVLLQFRSLENRDVNNYNYKFLPPQREMTDKSNAHQERQVDK